MLDAGIEKAARVREQDTEGEPGWEEGGRGGTRPLFLRVDRFLRFSDPCYCKLTHPDSARVAVYVATLACGVGTITTEKLPSAAVVAMWVDGAACRRAVALASSESLSVMVVPDRKSVV